MTRLAMSDTESGTVAPATTDALLCLLLLLAAYFFLSSSDFWLFRRRRLRSGLKPSGSACGSHVLPVLWAGSYASTPSLS